MTAPVRVRPPAPRRAPRTVPTRPAARASTTAARASTAAAQRAYERKTERSQRSVHSAPTCVPAPLPRREPFVALVIGLLAAGLIATLWLSTRSAESSYQLGAAHVHNQRLTEQAEALRRDVAVAGSPSALAQSATVLGMVLSNHVAHLVVAPGGAISLVGTPTPSTGTPGPSLIGVVPTAPTPAKAAPAPAAPVAPAAPAGIVPGANPAPTAGGA